MASERRGTGARYRLARVAGAAVVAASLLILVAACAVLAYPSLVASAEQALNLGPYGRINSYAHRTVDSFHATRTVYLGSAPPFDKTVTDADTVQALYDAAFALPELQGNMNGCPPTEDMTYNLAFAYHGAHVLTIYVNDCYEVSLGDFDTRLASSEFEYSLSSALDLGEYTMWYSTPPAAP